MSIVKQLGLGSLGGLLSFMIRNAFPLKKSACVGKNPDRGRASPTISYYSFKIDLLIKPDEF